MWLRGLFRHGACPKHVFNFLCLYALSQCGHNFTRHARVLRRLPLWTSPLIAAATSSFTKTRHRCEKVICRRIVGLFCDGQTRSFTAVPSEVWLKGKFSFSRSVEALVKNRVFPRLLRFGSGPSDWLSQGSCKSVHLAWIPFLWLPNWLSSSLVLLSQGQQQQVVLKRYLIAELWVTALSMSHWCTFYQTELEVTGFQTATFFQY